MFLKTHGDLVFIIPTSGHQLYPSHQLLLCKLSRYVIWAFVLVLLLMPSHSSANTLIFSKRKLVILNWLSNILLGCLNSEYRHRTKYCKEGVVKHCLHVLEMNFNYQYFLFRFSLFGDLFDEAIKNGLTAIQVWYLYMFKVVHTCSNEKIILLKHVAL